MSRQNSGCGMLFVGVLLIGVVLWLISAALWILAVAVPAAGLLAGGYFLWLAKQARDQDAEREAADAELDALVQDAAFDLAETITRWDALLLTKGIGTELQGRESEAAAIQQQLHNAQQALHVAPTAAHKIEAVIHADTVRRSAQRHL